MSENPISDEERLQVCEVILHPKGWTDKPDVYELEFLDGRPEKFISGEDWLKFGWRGFNWKTQIKENKQQEQMDG